MYHYRKILPETSVSREKLLFPLLRMRSRDLCVGSKTKVYTIYLNIHLNIHLNKGYSQLKQLNNLPRILTAILPT